MNFRSLNNSLKHYIAIGLCAALSLTCDESLPTYVFPERVLSLDVSVIETLNDRIAPPGQQVVHLVLAGENIHDEVFQDKVDIKGSIRIWWKRNPNRFRTIYLSEKNFVNPAQIRNGRLTLVPGQQFLMETYWNVKSDDSTFLPREMNFARLRSRVCDFNVACADPEVFVIEASVSVYDRIGYVAAPPREYTFVARVCIDCGFPPCPPPPGGCG